MNMCLSEYIFTLIFIHYNQLGILIMDSSIKLTIEEFYYGHRKIDRVPNIFIITLLIINVKLYLL